MLSSCLLVFMLSGASATYLAEREKILNLEKCAALGGNVILNYKEIEVNKVLLDLKRKEIERGIENSTTFAPRLHFFHAKHHIEQSDLFKLIKKLPKGSSLHTHLTAAVSSDYLFQYIISAQHLYANHINGQYKLKFFNHSDSVVSDGWELISTLRKNETYDEYIRSKISLFSNSMYPDIETVWKSFMGMFSATYDMYAYRKFFEDALYQALEELFQDNVIYGEFRASYLTLHELDGTKHPIQQFCHSFKSTVLKFKANNPKFIGARLIISLSRRLNNEGMQEAINVFKNLKSEFPDLIAGFDLIGFEELGRSLFDLMPFLNVLKNETKFFFHAGETNWYGTNTDNNLLDAVLLGSSRIGHAFSLVKHPQILKYVKKMDIAIEITPISNQVLKLVEDLRNHPGASLISQGLPLVICNDDPTFWGASGLSYDWYLAFLGMSSKDAGLEFLKQLAINSIKYSAMTENEKSAAFKVWGKQWDEFIDNIVSSNNTVF